MTKILSAGMLTATASSTTHLKTCWLVVLSDGTLRPGTSHHDPIPFDLGDGRGELTYLAKEGFLRSAIQSSETLASDDVDISSYFIVTGITRDDVRRGIYNGAELFLFAVDFTDLSLGPIRLRRGTFGEIEFGDHEYKVECRGLLHRYNRNIVEVHTELCRAQFGDNRCNVDKFPDLWLQGSYTIGDVVRALVYDGRRYTATTAGETNTGEPVFDSALGALTVDNNVIWRADNSIVDDGVISKIVASNKVEVTGMIDAIGEPNIFADGLIEWLPGSANSGLFQEILEAEVSTDDAHQFLYFLPMPFTVTVGDPVRIFGGCDKTIARCKTFPSPDFSVPSNIANRRAETFIPGDDENFKYPYQGDQ